MTMGSRFALWLNGHRTVKLATGIGLPLGLGTTSAWAKCVPMITKGRTAVAISAILIFIWRLLGVKSRDYNANLEFHSNNTKFTLNAQNKGDILPRDS
jgi:hypothetical protein